MYVYTTPARAIRGSRTHQDTSRRGRTAGPASSRAANVALPALPLSHQRLVRFCDTILSSIHEISLLSIYPILKVHFSVFYSLPKMAPLNRIIIDTDPGMSPQRLHLSLTKQILGVDDVLAMLLAFAAKPEEIEILMLSVTYGNVEVERYKSPGGCRLGISLTLFRCLRNVVALFHVIEMELEWRKARGQLEGFETMLASKPIVAVGAEHSLEDELLMADYFRMLDSYTNKPLNTADHSPRWRRWACWCT